MGNKCHSIKVIRQGSNDREEKTRVEMGTGRIMGIKTTLLENP